MNITLRQLEIFITIAKHANVSRAAEELFLSQSAASMALAELENQLGQILFNRRSRILILNESGRAMLPQAAELLARATEIEKMFAENEASLSGQIKIGASSTIGNYLLTSYIGAFSQEYPAVELNLEVGNTDQIIRSLLEFNIDVGYIEGLCHHPQIETIPWKQDRLIVFAAPEHPLAQKRRLQLTDLSAARWILREPGSGTREIFEKALQGKVERLKIGFEFGHTEAIKHAVRNNIGISCLSQRAVADLLKLGAVVELKTPFLNLERYFYCLIHRGKYRTNLFSRFIDFVNAAPLA